MQDIQEKARRIRLVIFDVDGVLTDGSLFLGDDGQEYKAFNSRDGHGIKMLQQSGIEIGIITGRSSEVVRLRMQSLGIKHVYQGQLDKRPAYQELRDKLGLSDAEIAYVGDDVVDLPIMRLVGLAIAVNDAHPFVTQHAHWLTPHAGGRGAARDVCELLMDAQGHLQRVLQSYL
ncbi:3-deoxy-manno-octulosonate-8-phosphatase KdsC [Candidatus Endoriftia persephone]|uniref:3-deoxy-D-manno-octulosonate 8-phosphate phosphatase KdsC n=3 Tax=Gammaproteobacteria TaxID=1236 RepID=G2FF74_9GAMM|nr:3-deoxy-manno-octulosonate-8-phosphatase KdsC [Candidatus Endoriftia persephone]EGV52127.1 3-deoxy-D-manno-octulosonate 8-phosphate phosphatase [endosymbiont of Riftia pachyptila (vent Ph05)]EGW54621.1 3-deoxy-D-manno-octulosonate 8-phosphate phosphatase [endosymbiont of Tevnia jerichonana (vent Tica)]USF87497.1 3-deoxy-manno-octulosonate-8-phosphatase KdsC [Candidatus Endoriftia persephone]